MNRTLSPLHRQYFLFALLICGVQCLFSTAVQAQNGWITGVTSTATSAQVGTSYSYVATSDGLTETPAGSGVYNLNTQQNLWNSAYGPDGEHALIQFNLGATYTVNQFRVWNYNAPGYTFRSFGGTSISYSLDGTTWTSVPQRFSFPIAPGTDTYIGVLYTFTTPIRARYIRFQADNTFRYGSYPDTCGLGRVRFYAGGTATTQTSTLTYPNDSGIVNVKNAPYNVKGDGVTDDTTAIQQAITDYEGTRQTIYLPNGTYLVSASLRCRNAYFYGNNNIRGQSRDGVVLRLKNNTFTNTASPVAVLYTGYNGVPGGGSSADWFNVNVGSLTIDTGTGNPGAIGLQYYSNNIGAARDIVIRSGDGQGVIGLDLGFTDMNGPLLVKGVTVNGFQTGIRAGYTVNSQTLENITLQNQTQVGLTNGGQALSIRGLNSQNTVTAVSNGGFMTLVDSTCIGTGNASTNSAVTNTFHLFARNLTTSGYSKAVQNSGSTPSAVGSYVAEFVSSGVLSLFPSPAQSLNLPIHETPDAVQDAASTWANVRNFRQIGDPDDTLGIQRAIDSGATTVYFPAQGYYYISQTILIRGNVRRLVGMFNQGIDSSVTPAFRLVEGNYPVVTFEQFNNINNIENASTRTLVLKDGFTGGSATGTGSVFLENIGGVWTFGAQNVWARQLNSEPQGTHCTNNGGNLWILGYKTERGGALVDTGAGGKTEILGGLCYTTTAGTLAPMFVNNESSLSVSLGEVCYSSDPFTVLVSETRYGTTKTLNRGGAPYYIGGSALPLFVGYASATTRTVSGSVTLDYSTNPAQPLTFAFRSVYSGTTLNRTQTLTPVPGTASGTFTFSDIPPGNYSVAIKGAKWLQKVVSADTRNLNATLTAVLPGGDADNNNVVDVDDLTLLLFAFNSKNGDGIYDARCDFDGNGLVDVGGRPDRPAVQLQYRRG